MIQNICHSKKKGTNQNYDIECVNLCKNDSDVDTCASNYFCDKQGCGSDDEGYINDRICSK